MTLKIIGAGMAGLLAANMLRHHNPVVIEAQEALPNNHSAVLRFRSQIVGDVLGIPFKRVNMIKAPLPWQNPVADALAYSFKCTKQRRTDRSITDGMVVEERFIAPTNLIDQMASRVDIAYNQQFNFLQEEDKVISTIPMPVLADALRYPKGIVWKYSSGVNIKAKVASCEAYVSVLVPDPEYPFSRISITGDELIVEIPRHSHFSNDGTIRTILDQAMAFVGLERAHIIGEPVVYNQRYSKILPIDEDQRRNFIHWASSLKGKAWQLGRFATWRPNLLLDDLVKDIRIIDRWISSPTAGYEMDMLRGRA